MQQTTGGGSKNFGMSFKNRFSTVDSPAFLLILGDFNARLDNSIDMSLTHIGPNVWGKRLSIDAADRDNALFLFEALQSLDLHIPQTFFSTPSSQRGYVQRNHLLR